MRQGTGTLVDAAGSRGAEAFNLAKTCSLGLRSGPFGERNRRWAPAFDRRTNRRLFMHDQVVDHPDVARPQCRHQDRLDVGEDRMIDPRQWA
jgi:hypothetical protein